MEHSYTVIAVAWIQEYMAKLRRTVENSRIRARQILNMTEWDSSATNVSVMNQLIRQNAFDGRTFYELFKSFGFSFRVYGKQTSFLYIFFV